MRFAVPPRLISPRATACGKRGFRPAIPSVRSGSVRLRRTLKTLSFPVNGGRPPRHCLRGTGGFAPGELAGQPLPCRLAPADGSLIQGIRHNGGGFLNTNGIPEGTEIIAQFKTEAGNGVKKYYYDQPSIWAYKASD